MLLRYHYCLPHRPQQAHSHHLGSRIQTSHPLNRFVTTGHQPPTRSLLFPSRLRHAPATRPPSPIFSSEESSAQAPGNAPTPRLSYLHPPSIDDASPRLRHGKPSNTAKMVAMYTIMGRQVGSHVVCSCLFRMSRGGKVWIRKLRTTAVRRMLCPYFLGDSGAGEDQLGIMGLAWRI